jgi:hypothetical protein
MRGFLTVLLYRVRTQQMIACADLDTLVERVYQKGGLSLTRMDRWTLYGKRLGSTLNGRWQK